jgi:hypothetical protein
METVPTKSPRAPDRSGAKTDRGLLLWTIAGIPIRPQFAHVSRFARDERHDRLVDDRMLAHPLHPLPALHLMGPI